MLLLGFWALWGLAFIEAWFGVWLQGVFDRAVG
jgi:hypothetical protein